ncbi:hypothetical protein ACFL6C_12525, partial [Myxococcota bacterium]
MKVGRVPTFKFIEQGLKKANSNDLGSVDQLLEEWPEDIFITGAGIQASPLSEAAKGVLIYRQMKRLDPDLFADCAMASNIAEVFSKAADQETCEELAGFWWRGLEPKAPLRVQGELSLEATIPDPYPEWRAPYELVLERWSPFGSIQGKLFS